MNKTHRQYNLLGSMWMIISMAAFAVEDSLFKHIAQLMPLSQTLIIFGVGGAFVFGVISSVRGESLLQKDVVSAPMCWRVFFEVTGRLFFILAVTLTPLSSSTAVLQAVPIVVVLGAALFFKEKVGWRRWAAICIGLTGVLIVLQPGADSFNKLSLLAVIGMLGLAGRDLTSRAAPLSLSSYVLGFYGFISVVIAGVIYALWSKADFVVPSLSTGMYLALIIFVGVIAYNTLMLAMRTGEVSAVTPYRYSRLIFGIALGVLVFEETLDTNMIVGCFLIVLSGLFILWRSMAKQSE